MWNKIKWETIWFFRRIAFKWKMRDRDEPWAQ